jgi:histone-lysine N-methyltransferase SETMAR
MLVKSGRKVSRTDSPNDRGREINVGSLFNPNGLAIVDLLPQGDSFTAQYFNDQILKPLNQGHSMKSADIAGRSVRLHFDNSRCHTAKIVSEEMTCLRCKRVPHPPDSPDLAIADFYLFRILKHKLQGIDVRDDEELKSEILTIFQGIPLDELKKSFDHSTETCQWGAADAGNESPSSPDNIRFILSVHFSSVPRLKTYWARRAIITRGDFLCAIPRITSAMIFLLDDAIFIANKFSEPVGDEMKEGMLSELREPRISGANGERRNGFKNIAFGIFQRCVE